jgi:hypothetical protein
MIPAWSPPRPALDVDSSVHRKRAVRASSAVIALSGTSPTFCVCALPGDNVAGPYPSRSHTENHPLDDIFIAKPGSGRKGA